MLSLLCFGLTRITPGDPVESRMVAEGVRAAENDALAYERAYARAAASLGYDRPPFYFSITPAALPDTLYRITISERRKTVRELALQSGNWPLVQSYYQSLLQSGFYRPQADPQTVAAARRLLLLSDRGLIERQLAGLDDEAGREIIAAYRRLESERRPARLLLPNFTWYGFDNQYHNYLVGLLHGDLGSSYDDRRPVADRIAVALPRTLLLNSLAIFIVYLLAIPLGLYMAKYAGSRFDRYATLITFIGFGLPSFWVATLVTNFFTTPAFGMDWFPSMGFGDIPPDAGWFTALRIRMAHLFLPVACLVYPSLAYVSRHLRAAALSELKKPYVRTARMKGLAGSQVLWKHVFRNASFPLVTLLGGLLPVLLAGSVLIERIFNLPGMGLLLYNSATARDWPVVIALVLINGLLTAVGLLLADIGYAIIDPRVRLAKTSGI